MALVSLFVGSTPAAELVNKGRAKTPTPGEVFRFTNIWTFI